MLSTSVTVHEGEPAWKRSRTWKVNKQLASADFTDLPNTLRKVEQEKQTPNATLEIDLQRKRQTQHLKLTWKRKHQTQQLKPTCSPSLVTALADLLVRRRS
jgi:hypothetical protein